MAGVNKKQQLKNAHEQKLMNLYDTYYKKCLDGDTNSFKAFIDCSNELFQNEDDNEIAKLLRNVTFEGDNE